MAAIPPVSINKCRGTYADGSVNNKFYCKKGYDDNMDVVYTCATWRKFRVNCPKVNFLCSNQSEAWVAASTVCRLRLF